MISVRLTHPDHLERVIGAIPVSDFDGKPSGNQRPGGFLRTMARSAIEQTRLRAAHQFEGRLLLADGSPAVGAQVKTATKYQPYSWKFHSADDYGFSSGTKTNKDGRFSLITDARSTLTAWLPGQAPLLVDTLQEHFGLASDGGRNVFRFPPAIRLKGRVLDDQGRPVPRAVITARREFAWNESNMPLSFSINCAADEQGEYELPPLPTDQYKLSIGSQLKSDSSPGEYNRFIRSFNTTRKPEFETEPLDLVFVPVSRKLEFTDPLPRLDLQASPMVTVKVNVEFPDGADPERSTDVGITGLMDGRNWQGRYAKADENGVAILRAPKGLRLASIKTGFARHRRSPDADIEIGEAIHIGELKEDRGGFTVIKPKFAKLNVKLTLSDELSRKHSKGKNFISITAEYEKKGYRENTPTPQRLILTGSKQTGASEYSGRALPDEPILLRVSVKEGDERRTVHEEKLTLAAGEERLRKISIGEATKEAATEKEDDVRSAVDGQAAKQQLVLQNLRKQTKAAAEKAAGYLIGKQRADGTWPSSSQSDTHIAGATALVALAIYDSGPKSDKAIQAATQYLLKASPEMTKEVALQALFLHRIGKPGAALLRRNVKWLVDAQVKDGPDAGSWSYRDSSAGSRGDGANTAYAVLALSVTAPAGTDGEDTVPQEVWQLAQTWLLKSQQANGGWGYVTRQAQTSGGMTVCALAGLKAIEARLEKSPQSQVAIKRGEAWLNAHWSATSNPGVGSAWNMFYLRWACRALDGQVKLGDRHWHSEVLVQLLKAQRKSGEFSPKSPTISPVIETAFGLAILKHRSGRALDQVVR